MDWISALSKFVAEEGKSECDIWNRHSKFMIASDPSETIGKFEEILSEKITEEQITEIKN